MACLHDHECESHNCAADWSLYNHVDIPKVVALNESVAGSVKSVFKPSEQRLETSAVVLARCWDAMLDGDVLTGNRLLCGWWSG
ncbi:uncharacterized protein [Lolium perenne]|uniref:uncharacterized protein n=1 Tax=Lolium perenne TaxID=4522 RepID=UPI003A99B6AE